jgi:hypothetical protein
VCIGITVAFAVYNCASIRQTQFKIWLTFA